MGRRKEHRAVPDYTVQYVRGVIIYLCIVVLFGSVILLVQAGMEEKRIRYKITERAREKKELLEEVRKLDIEIARLENYERISGLAREHLPHLNPPQHPAIRIAVEGLREGMQRDRGIPVQLEQKGWLQNLRKEWRRMERHFQEYLNSFIE